MHSIPLFSSLFSSFATVFWLTVYSQILAIYLVYVHIYVCYTYPWFEVAFYKADLLALSHRTNHRISLSSNSLCMTDCCTSTLLYDLSSMFLTLSGTLWSPPHFSECLVYLDWRSSRDKWHLITTSVGHGYDVHCSYIKWFSHSFLVSE